MPPEGSVEPDAVAVVLHLPGRRHLGPRTVQHLRAEELLLRGDEARVEDVGQSWCWKCEVLISIIIYTLTRSGGQEHDEYLLQLPPPHLPDHAGDLVPGLGLGAAQRGLRLRRVRVRGHGDLAVCKQATRVPWMLNYFIFSSLWSKCFKILIIQHTVVNVSTHQLHLHIEVCNSNSLVLTLLLQSNFLIHKQGGNVFRSRAPWFSR